MNNRDRIIELYHKIEKKGFIQSHRYHNTGIGKTFEDLIGVEENNIDEPDLLGYEIKCHREMAESYVTLFTKAPSFPLRANKQLLQKYGMIQNDKMGLHTSMFATIGNTYHNIYSFQLKNDKQAQKLYIVVRDLQTNRIIDCSTGYTYNDLRVCISRKLKNLFYVEAKTIIKDGREWFHFCSAEIYEDPTFDRFLYLIDNGYIMYDIRMGTYNSGPKEGLPHDHGSGFRIKAKNLPSLYQNFIPL